MNSPALFLSIAFTLGSELLYFIGAFLLILNARDEHFFTKKEEITKTPTKFCGSLREFVGVF